MQTWYWSCWGVTRVLVVLQDSAHVGLCIVNGRLANHVLRVNLRWHASSQDDTRYFIGFHLEMIHLVMMLTISRWLRASQQDKVKGAIRWVNMGRGVGWRNSSGAWEGGGRIRKGRMLYNTIIAGWKVEHIAISRQYYLRHVYAWRDVQSQQFKVLFSKNVYSSIPSIGLACDFIRC